VGRSGVKQPMPWHRYLDIAPQGVHVMLAHIVLFSQQRNENTLQSFAGKNFLLEFDKDDNRYNYSLSFIAQLMGFRFNEKWRIKLLLRTWW